MTQPADAHGPNVRFPPPVLFAAGFLVGGLIDVWAYHLWPAFTGTTARAVDGIGVVLIVGGLALAIAGVLTFKRAKTAIIPHHAATLLVSGGPYRFTRNPMYTGLTLTYIGLSVVTSMGWPLLLLPFVLLALYQLVITREERYLTSAFGEEYRAYRLRVGRWV